MILLQKYLQRKHVLSGCQTWNVYQDDPSAVMKSAAKIFCSAFHAFLFFLFNLPDSAISDHCPYKKGLSLILFQTTATLQRFCLRSPMRARLSLF